MEKTTKEKQYDTTTKKYFTKLSQKILDCSSEIITTFEKFYNDRENVSECRNIQVQFKPTCYKKCQKNIELSGKIIMSYDTKPIICNNCQKIVLEDGTVLLSKFLKNSALTSFKRYIKEFEKEGCSIITSEEEFLKEAIRLPQLPLIFCPALSSTT